MPGPQVLLLLLPTLCRSASSNSDLPSLPATALPTGTAHLERDGKWWAQVGDRVYHAPLPASGLSGHVSNYYYALGSESALPEELRQSRVGGQGRLHLFHIPPDSEHMESLLQADAMKAGSRRSSLSGLQKLTHGMNLSSESLSTTQMSSTRIRWQRQGILQWRGRQLAMSHQMASMSISARSPSCPTASTLLVVPTMGLHRRWCSAFCRTRFRHSDLLRAATRSALGAVP